MKKTVIITGGNRGIGLDITTSFVEAGYKVFVTGRNEYDLKSKFGNDISFFKMDVRNPIDHKLIVEKVIEENGQLDCYINNAGFSKWMPIEKIEDEFLSEILDTNLKGVFWGCKYASISMKSGSSIINISSLAGKRGSSNNSAYCATKFGVNGITQSLAKEIGPRNIRVNALCPVLIPTDGLVDALNQPHSPSAGENPIDWINNFGLSNAAFKRLPTGKEVGSMCVFLASKSSSAITGQCINVDCGVLPQ